MFPNLSQLKSLRRKGNLTAVYKEITGDMETPISVFLKITQDKPYSFLLESVEGEKQLARYSFIGLNPYKLVGFYDIQKELKKYKFFPCSDTLPSFLGGAVGFLSYEAIRYFEDIPKPKTDLLKLPITQYAFYDTVVIFDHLKQKILLVKLVKLDKNLEKNYRKAEAEINTMLILLNEPLSLTSQPQMGHKIQLSQQSIERYSNFSRQSYLTAVRKAKNYIANGDIFQVILSHRLKIPTNQSPFDIYRRLRTANPSPYMYYLNYPNFQIIGASPEMLVRSEDDELFMVALAGTRPRGKNPEEDKKLAKELLQDSKDLAEHMMLVDLARNDVGRVSEIGTVNVTRLKHIVRYSHVMHIASDVRGRLAKDKTIFDAFASCFPHGTVSGAPKIRAMEIIAELEKSARGPYAGAIGYFGFNNNMDNAICIRTIVIKRQFAYIQAGAGIVADSVPELEWQETINKMKGVIMAL